MKRSKAILGVIMLFCMVWDVSAGNQVSLVREGKPEAVIVIAGGAKETKLITFAASELQKYIEKMTGAKLPVIMVNDTGFGPEYSPASYPNFKTFLQQNKNVILVGESRYTHALELSAKDLKSDGYRISTRENVIAILGRDSGHPDPATQMMAVYPQYHANSLERAESVVGCMGTLYGVYRFLEELGVRWFYPWEFGEVVPSQKSVSVGDMNIGSEPYFKYRAECTAIDGVPNQSEIYVWERRIGFGLGESAPDTTCHPFTTWTGRYRETHPEYFAKNGNAVDFDQICFSSPAARERMLEDVREFFTKYSDPVRYPYFIVTHNDGHIRSCDCDLCRAKRINTNGITGTDSLIVVETVVWLAEKIKKEFPDRGILLGSYNNYLRPPPDYGKKLPDNVAIFIACSSRLQYWSEDFKNNLHDIINGWRKLGPKEIFLWEYYNCDSGEAVGVPMLAPHFIGEDMAYLKKISDEGPRLNGEEIFAIDFGPFLPEQNKQRRWWFCLNYYITAKLLWDPSLNVDNLLDDYFGKFYGPAAASVKRYFARVEEVWAKGNHGIRSLYGSREVPADLPWKKYEQISGIVRKPWDNLFTEDVMAELSKYLDEAEKAAPEKTYKERVSFLREGFQYMRQCAEKAKKAGQVATSRVEVYKAEDAPKFDARAEDLDRMGRRLRLGEDMAGAPAKLSTDAWTWYDGDCLYISFICAKKPGEKCKSRCTMRDDKVWEDESVEIFISADGTRENYYQIVVNSLGTSAESNYNRDSAWNPDLKIQALEEDGLWRVRIGIPFKALGHAPAAGGEWYFNLCRNSYSGGKAECQSLFPTGGAFHSPAKFGRLVFSGTKPKDGTREP